MVTKVSLRVTYSTTAWRVPLPTHRDAINTWEREAQIPSSAWSNSQKPLHYASGVAMGPAESLEASGAPLREEPAPSCLPSGGEKVWGENLQECRESL